LLGGEPMLASGARHFRQAWAIWGALFQGGPGAFLRRLLWETPQTLLGLLAAHFLNLFAKVRRVESYRGCTLIQIGSNWGALSLGSFIFANRSAQAASASLLFVHECGHERQSRRAGWLYLFKYGLPSLGSATFHRAVHHLHWCEQDANLRARAAFANAPGFDAERFAAEYPVMPGVGLRQPRWWEYVPGIFPVFVPMVNWE
jgi:hypothetical protein